MNRTCFGALCALLIACFSAPACAQGTTTISNLPSATLPLAGTEVVPVVQGGVTKKAPASAFGASAGVTSFNSRTGTVTPQSGDYAVGQVTGAAPLASPALTGTPTAPTPSTSDNSTTVATTAYVKAQGAGSSATITQGNGILVSTSGSACTSCTIGVTTSDNAYSSSHSIGASDMAATMSLTGSGTLTFPAISGTVLAAGMTTCWSNIGSGTWTISTTPTINGLPSTSLVPGSGACVTSNGTSLDYQPGISLPSSTQLGGVVTTSLASHNFANGISSSTGALTGTQPAFTDLSGSATAAQMPAFTGDVTTSAGSTATTLATVNSNTGSCGDATHVCQVTLNGKGLATAASPVAITGTGGGGGMFNYSDNGVTVTAGTYYAPAGGGGAPASTEANVSVPSPSATVVANLSVSISGTLGGASTGFTVTLRKNGSGTALTCNFNPSSATACTDFTHSVTVAQSDVLDWQIVTAGTVVGTPTITIAANNGTSSVGVTSVAASVPGGFSVSGSPVTTSGTLAITANGTSGGIPYYSGATTMASSGVLAANLPVIGGGAGVAPTTGTVSGNTTKFVTTTGAQTSGNCVSIDANGNYIASGSPCGGGGVDMGWTGRCSSLPTTATTDFCNPVGTNGAQTTNTLAYFLSGETFTMGKLYVNLTTAPGGSATHTFTVYVNGSTTAITCIVTSAATTCNDTAHTASINAGDLVALQDTATSTPAGANARFGMGQ